MERDGPPDGVTIDFQSVKGQVDESDEPIKFSWTLNQAREDEDRRTMELMVKIQTEMTINSI
eukprot:m.201658 g.201658  ORF g.201658 m.201658 type:complete len:62 (-) comp15349_c1_seq2:433-618(-)